MKKPAIKNQKLNSKESQKNLLQKKQNPIAKNTKKNVPEEAGVCQGAATRNIIHLKEGIEKVNQDLRHLQVVDRERNPKRHLKKDPIPPPVEEAGLEKDTPSILDAENQDPLLTDVIDQKKENLVVSDQDLVHLRGAILGMGDLVEDYARDHSLIHPLQVDTVLDLETLNLRNPGKDQDPADEVDRENDIVNIQEEGKVDRVQTRENLKNINHTVDQNEV